MSKYRNPSRSDRLTQYNTIYDIALRQLGGRYSIFVEDDMHTIKQKGKPSVGEPTLSSLTARQHCEKLNTRLEAQVKALTNAHLMEVNGHTHVPEQLPVQYRERG